MRPSFAHHHDASEKQKQRREAKRRKAHCSPIAACAAARLSSPPPSLAREIQGRGCARLPALRHGTRHRLSPRWLSPRPGFSQRHGGTVFCRHAAKLSRVKHAPCRPVFLPADRCPRAARERFARPRAGIRTRSTSKIASGMRPSVSEIRSGAYIAVDGNPTRLVEPHS